MKIVIYTNVIKDQKGRVQFPYGIAQFQSFMSSVIISHHKYRHGIHRANKRDMMIWAFKDETGCWYLLGDGFVTDKYQLKNEKDWTFDIEGARLYPRMVPLNDLSFVEKVKKNIHLGAILTWNEYKELLEKASEPLVE